jgi:hypothetical protein
MKDSTNRVGMMYRLYRFKYQERKRERKEEDKNGNVTSRTVYRCRKLISKNPSLMLKLILHTRSIKSVTVSFYR